MGKTLSISWDKGPAVTVAKLKEFSREATADGVRYEIFAEEDLPPEGWTALPEGYVSFPTSASAVILVPTGVEDLIKLKWK